MMSDRQPQRVQALLDLGRPAEAFELAQHLLTARPDDPWLLVWAALAKQRLGEHKVARDYAQRSLVSDPMFAFGQVVLAYTFIRERPRRALREFERAVVMDPLSHEAHLGVTKAVWRISEAPIPSAPPIQNPVWCRRSEIERAREAADRAVELEPGIVDCHEASARVAFLERRYAPALEAIERARAVDPNRASVIELEATILSHLGLHAEAGDALASAVRSEPVASTGIGKLRQIEADGRLAVYVLPAVLAVLMTVVSVLDPDLTGADLAWLFGTYVAVGAMILFYWKGRQRAKALSDEARQLIEHSRQLD